MFFYFAINVIMIMIMTVMMAVPKLMVAGR